MSSTPFNAYELLEVLPTATENQIKAAFKKKALEFHPDKNDNTKAANVLFTILTHAKDVLLDPAKRLQHDYIQGIKVKPKPQVETVYRNKEEYQSDWGSLLIAGVAGLAIGATVAKRIGKKKR